MILINGMDTVVDSPLKRPMTGEPTLSPSAGTGPPGGGLGVASCRKQISVGVSIRFIQCLRIKQLKSRLPGTARRGSATAADLDPRPLELLSLLLLQFLLCSCIQ